MEPTTAAAIAAPAPLRGTAVGETSTDERSKIRTVIAASSAGTIIEWYDFFVFGTLATILATHFYPKGNETVAFLSTLATHGAGFAVRPLGAVVFGRIGDIVGRKYAFLVTLLIMGGATAAIGLLPTFASVGILAPVLLVALRLAQGLAIGGEYGGAAIYVAEHSPKGRRGYFTSFIQTTATLGLVLALVVNLSIRTVVGETAFAAWGWRIPFLLSAVLVVLSYIIRRRMQESPVFVEMKAAGKTSQMPVREAFGTWVGWKRFLVSLFGVTAGQAVVFYTGQFYALFFLQKVLNVPLQTSYFVIAMALALGTPFILVFGALSDRIGRKQLLVGGNLLAALCYYPLFRAMSAAADPLNVPVLVACVFAMMLFVAMTYGPIAAYLVESYPARIRYTAMSLPYHVGNGWFGGWLPLIAVWAVGATGNRFAGLVYPIVVAGVSAIIGALVLRDTRHVELHDGA
ncbi:MAG: MHS family MFS transporter [Gemmatimonadaceae bacterium]|jgi:MFS family permease|nr:MHS family MFS transporter [Gemmatimonadaceae bacterium]